MDVKILMTVIIYSELPKHINCTFAIILAKFSQILVLFFSQLHLIFKFNLILSVVQIYESY